MRLARRLYVRLVVPPPPYRLDPRLDRVVEGLCRGEVEKGRVLNLGAGSTWYGSRVVNLDVQHFEAVHVCGRGEHLPFLDATFSGVLLRGVLEHVREADAVLDEVRRVLRPSGFLYVEVPFMQPYHQSPEDHRRFTLPGLRHVLSDFREIDAGVQVGPGSALAWVFRETVASILSGGSPWLYRKILTVAGWSSFWLRYLDAFVVSAPHVANAASAFYFLGRRETP